MLCAEERRTNRHLQPRSLGGRGFSFALASRPGGVDLIHGIPGHLGGTDARPEPTRPPVKCTFCDRHHIASAMAELSSYLWIVPHTRSFYVPPKYSAPLTRGLFLRPRLPASRERKSPTRMAPRCIGPENFRGAIIIDAPSMFPLFGKANATKESPGRAGAR